MLRQLNSDLSLLSVLLVKRGILGRKINILSGQHQGEAVPQPGPGAPAPELPWKPGGNNNHRVLKGLSLAVLLSSFTHEESEAQRAGHLSKTSYLEETEQVSHNLSHCWARLREAAVKEGFLEECVFFWNIGQE